MTILRLFQSSALYVQKELNVGKENYQIIARTEEKRNRLTDYITIKYHLSLYAYPRKSHGHYRNYAFKYIYYDITYMHILVTNRVPERRTLSIYPESTWIWL